MKRIDYHYGRVDGRLFAIASSTDPEIDGIKATGDDTNDMFWNLKNYLDHKLGGGVYLNKI